MSHPIAGGGRLNGEKALIEQMNFALYGGCPDMQISLRKAWAVWMNFVFSVKLEVESSADNKVFPWE